MHFYNVSIIDSFQCTMFESFEQKNGFCMLQQQQQRFLYQSASAQYPTIFSFFSSFLVKVRFVLLIFCLFFLLLVERRVGKFTKVLLTIKLHRWQQHRMYKGSSSGMGVASIYRLSPAQLNLFVVDNLSKQRFDEILGFLGIPRILAVKYACCAAKAKVMWLTWMLVMLCRLLLLLLLLGLRLSLKKD